MIHYDLHIHTALSPCADDAMTPNNIVNMAMISGLDVIAITDHNTTKNCEAVLKVAKETPLTVICGMELCTSEEVHVVCLLPSLDSANYFERYVATKSIDMKNRIDIFGHQSLMNEHDNIVGEEERMLSMATSISVTDLHHILNHYGGVAVPAHIDRSSNGIISALGTVPEDCYFGAVEIKNIEQFKGTPHYDEIAKRYNIITDSDAHYLESIKEEGDTLPVTASFEEIAAYLAIK